MDTLEKDQIARWIDARGPARSELLSPLADRLVQRPPAPPDDYETIVEPACWLLKKAGGKGLSLDQHDGLGRSFAAKANQECGFVSPAQTEAGEETFLEIDFLLMWLRGHDTLITAGRKAFLSHLGRGFLDDRAALWYLLASCLGLGRPQGYCGEAWELILGHLLQEDAEFGPLFESIKESAAEYGYNAYGADAKLEEATTVTFFALYTALRALDAFVPKDIDDRKPRLTESGKLAAIEGLRAAVATSAEWMTPTEAI